MNQGSRRGLTLTELLTAVVTLSLIVAILLPAMSFARGKGRSTSSMDNLRTLAAAHFVYSADWNGRQLTFIVDDAATYGDYGDWWAEYAAQHGSDGSWGHPGNHPAMELGWGRLQPDGSGRFFMYETVQPANAGLVIPVNWSSPGTGVDFLGSFRLPNVAQFHQYLNGRFYDRVMYAPADEVVVDAVNGGFEAPDEYWPFANVSGVGSIPAWSSYCLSPAGMYNPEVLRHDDPDDKNANGWRDPFSLPDGFASPSFSQFTYPALKTHMLEHHWLQNAPFPNCNPAFEPGTYGDEGCEPYYFNHGLASVPMTLFYDGHVEGVGVQRAMDDDAAVREMTGLDNWGLWSKDTPWGEDGYFSEYGYDAAQTSFHINTTDGAEGRDVLAPGVASSTWRPPAPPDRLKKPTRRVPDRADLPVTRMQDPN